MQVKKIFTFSEIYQSIKGLKNQITAETTSDVPNL